MAAITKAAFLDMQSMLDSNHPCHSGEEHSKWLSDIVEGLELLHLAGYVLIVLTHETTAAHSRCGQKMMSDVETALLNELSASGIPLHGYYRCPHHHQDITAPVADQNRCRRSQSGLLRQAACELHVDPQRSWFIGDRLDDMEAGRTAGCRTILLVNGQETTWDMTEQRWPGFIAANMIEATSLVLLVDVDQFLDRALESLGPDDEEEGS